MKSKYKKVIPNIFVCETDDFHPYECDGVGKCIHCDRENITTHRIRTCTLCEDNIVVNKVKIINI